VNSRKELIEVFKNFRSLKELSFIHVILKPGNTKAPNIPLSPEEVTKRFKEALKRV
jgi:thiamine pyrophosphate-dependent acetolactate synthase large subunit-like protein